MPHGGQPQGTASRMSIHEGVSALLDPGTADTGGQPVTADVRDEQPEAEETPIETDGQTDDAEAPDGEPASDEALEGDASESDEDDEVEPDDSSAIEPPQHWDEDRKAQFRQMPKEAQEFVLERNRETDQAFTRKTEELAQHRKAYEQELQGLQQERQRYAQYLDQLSQELQQGTQQEPDWQRLYQEDPDEYNRQRWEWQDRKERQQAVEAEKQRVAEQQRREQQERLQQHLQQEQSRLIERLPQWQDRATAQREKSQVMEYAKSRGYTDDELARAYDSRAVEMMYKAMKWDNLQQSKPATTKKVNKAPKMAKSGTPATGKDSAKRRERESFQRLSKTGRKEDAVEYLLTKSRQR
jgi:hypothetical protein